MSQLQFPKYWPVGKGELIALGHTILGIPYFGGNYNLLHSVPYPTTKLGCSTNFLCHHATPTGVEQISHYNSNIHCNPA